MIRSPYVSSLSLPFHSLAVRLFLIPHFPGFSEVPALTTARSASPQDIVANILWGKSRSYHALCTPVQPQYMA
jgi:hypothetical protein